MPTVCRFYRQFISLLFTPVFWVKYYYPHFIDRLTEVEERYIPHDGTTYKEWSQNSETDKTKDLLFPIYYLSW